MGNAIASASLMKPSTVIQRVAEATARPFLSTSDAAQMLGLSTTMVQTLVDQGELKGWKTRGGHRRIALASVNAYQNGACGAMGLTLKPAVKPSVTVVVESAHLRQALLRVSAEWAPVVEVAYYESVTEAFLEMSSKRPHMLVLEMNSPSAQQEKTLRVLENFNKKMVSPMSVAVVTEDKQCLSPFLTSGASSFQVVSGPMSAAWLHAYLAGMMALTLS